METPDTTTVPMSIPVAKHVLVTGATGYIGGRLTPRLVEQGLRVRCLVRDRRRLDPRLAASTQVVEGDVGDVESLRPALEGITEAYYLVHAMRDRQGDFAAVDRQRAQAFGEACARAGVRRIIYLGGLGDSDGEGMSEHLRSRQETGAALAEAGVPVLEFRAAVIIGSGSASFEMLRTLTERLPVMITPRWVRTRCQPIAVADMLRYLQAALEHPEAHGVYEIGGADVVSYQQMMLIYAEERGLSRWLIPVPVLTPALSGWWVHLVTPVPRAIARPLIDGLRTEVVADDAAARELFALEPMSYRQAICRALQRIERGDVETAWHSSFASLADGAPSTGVPMMREGIYIERHERACRAHPTAAFRACCAIGGQYGWPAGGALWRLRALMDRLAGGVGMRRGRRDHEELRVGDAVDFWRVIHIKAPQRLLLRAEMKLPGEGWLEFCVRPQAGGSSISVTAFYEPRGFWGFAYWLATLPLHRWIFPALTRSLCRRALHFHRLAA